MLTLGINKIKKLELQLIRIIYGIKYYNISLFEWLILFVLFQVRTLAVIVLNKVRFNYSMSDSVECVYCVKMRYKYYKAEWQKLRRYLYTLFLSNPSKLHE